MVFNPHLTSPFDKLRTAPDLGGGIFAASPPVRGEIQRQCHQLKVSDQRPVPEFIEGPAFRQAQEPALLHLS